MFDFAEQRIINESLQTFRGLRSSNSIERLIAECMLDEYKKEHRSYVASQKRLRSEHPPIVDGDVIEQILKARRSVKRLRPSKSPEAEALRDFLLNPLSKSLARQ